MQKKFVKDLLILQLLNWLIKPLWILGVERYVQNQSGDALYGKYYVIFNFALLFVFLLDFGINNYLSTEISKTGNTSISGPLLKIRLGLTGVYIILLFSIGLSINLSWSLLLMVAVSQIFSGMTLFFRAILQGFHAFKKDAVISVLDRFIAIVSFCICILFFKYSDSEILMLFIWVQLAGYAISMITAGILCINIRNRETRSSEYKIDFASVLKKTFLFAALALLMSLFTRFDVVLLKNLLMDGEYQAGIYAKGFRLLDAGLIFSGMLSVQLMPLFGKLHSGNDELKKLLWLATRIILIVSVPVAIVSLFYNKELLTMLYRQSGNAINSVFVLLMFTFIPMATVHVFGTLLTALHRLKYLILASLICVIFNLCMDLLLIPDSGATGAAIACLTTQFLFASLCIFKSIRLLNIRFDFGKFFSILLFIILFLAGCFFLKKYLSVPLGFILSFVLFIAAILISGIFKAEIKKIKERLPFLR